MSKLSGDEKLNILRLLGIASRSILIGQIEPDIDVHGVVRFSCNDGDFSITIETGED